MNIIYFILFGLAKYTNSFVTNANIVIRTELDIFNKIIDNNNLLCHSQSSRIKTFESSLQKLNKINSHNVYDLYDLIAFRYVFYNKDDLLKFYHHFKQEKEVWYIKNYVSTPKINGYSAMHMRYKNTYEECPIKQLECQLYVIKDYYESVYGNSKYHKNYTLYF